ncbi:sensor histidine kinase [Pontibacillus salipaludis]|uniref:histidine kinase n=1 Tax=Pontibacillus salipaludis TaxID=1697394 RepID=A0ABQ1QA78_9BACI|nr:HAMP domain-containing sensor histidine kinase [Pontibacillus salipaludis]GGD20813.1 two-component sensor histidine kinase [Pontibacillus salipaludis]
MKNSKRTLLYQFTMTYIWGYTAILLVMAVIVSGSITYFLLHETNRELNVLEEKLQNLEESGIQAKLNELLYPNYSDYAIRISRNENVLATSEEWQDFEEESEGYPTWFGPFGFRIEEGIYYKRDLYMGGPKGERSLNIWVQLEDETEFLGIILQVFFFIGLASLLIGAYILYGLTKKRLSPLLSITEEIKEMEKHKDGISRINEPKEPLELRELSGAFNQLLHQLEEHVEREKGFIANASHELRTPLTAFRGHINLLKRWGKKDEYVLEQSLQALGEESDRMERITHQMLTLAQHENNVLKAERVNITKILHLLVEKYKEGTSLQINLEKDEDLELMGDEEQLRQVFVILLDNALRYTKEGRVSVKAYQKDNDLTISISDTGVGIPEGEQGEIFNRFYRVDRNRSRETGGTGLGLSIAKAIVEKHRGMIRIESKSGEGSTFIVVLPVKD